MSTPSSRGKSFWRTVPWVGLICYATVRTLFHTPNGRTLLDGGASPARASVQARQFPAHFPPITLPAPNDANQRNTVAAANAEPERLPPIPPIAPDSLDVYRIVDGNYYNELFRLTVPIPPNWTAAKLNSDELRVELCNFNSETVPPHLIQWRAELLRLKNARVPTHLIAMRPTDYSGWRIVPTIMIWAYDPGSWPDSGTYLREQTILKNLANRAAPYFRLGKMNACTIIVNRANPAIYETHAAGDLDGYILTFIARAGDPDTLVKMHSVFENVHVGDAVAATK